MKKSAAVLFALAIMIAPAGADQTDAWNQWTALLGRQCPARHVDWICDGCYLDYLENFQATLSPTARSRIASIADIPARCHQERMGFSCEMGASLEAYRRLGFLHRFAAFGCAHIRCTEMALCETHWPNVPQRHL